MSMFRTWDDKGTDWMMVLMVSIFLLVFLIFIPIGIYDELYIKPVAANKANNYCISLGFDQYKSFSRIGILSENPVAIKCEYAERYTDLGVRVNTP